VNLDAVIIQRQNFAGLQSMRQERTRNGLSNN